MSSAVWPSSTFPTTHAFTSTTAEAWKLSAATKTPLRSSTWPSLWIGIVLKHLPKDKWDCEWCIPGKERLRNALRAWGDALESTPPLAHSFWYGYAERCLYYALADDYRRARYALLKTFGGTDDPYIAERTSRASLLLPLSGDELKQAVALADRAVTSDRTKYPSGAYPHFLFVKGLADYRQGQFDQAIAVMQGDASRVPGPNPRLVLAMALFHKGQQAEARKEAR